MLQHISFTIGTKQYKTNGVSRDISIHIDPNTSLSCFHLPKPTIAPASSGSWIGDTRKGSTVNCEIASFCAHSSGTHTECVGHLTNERFSITECFNDWLSVGLLITVAPVQYSTCDGS
eukprot:TRINITY_DN7418_c0_g1_i1.p1 TRINITY_DN7418_c0_g1~~TRINITY_DN7418_c0_g1_i1.p1  ORF type:complete len:118 (-),score=20.35 TRINITY_DN7418_c0_g1_i1:69-422(-)